MPGAYDTVTRADKVTVKALDRLGNPFEISADGLLGECLQHEIDHLDGMVFVDRVEDPSLIRHVPPKSEKKEELL